MLPLTQSKKCVTILIKQQILITIAGDLASSLAWFVYDVYTVHVQQNRGKWGMLCNINQDHVYTIVKYKSHTNLID